MASVPNPMRLGLLCHPTVGGSGILATELALALGRRGHEVHLIALARPHRLPAEAPGVHLHVVQPPAYDLFQHPHSALALASTLVELQRDLGLDLIHAHYAVPHAVSAWMARQASADGGPPVVVTLHGTDVTGVGQSPAYRPMIRAALLAADALTAPSAFLADQARQRLSLPESTAVEVVPNFVDTDHFRPLADPAAPRPEIDALFGPEGHGQPVICHVSNLRPVKRVLDAVAAFARARSRIPCRLLVVGEGPDRASAESRLAALGLAHAARFTGPRGDVAELLRQSDVFCLPSESESFGLAALEAMSSGLPVVATATGGLPEVVPDGRAGLLAPVGDVEALGQALARLCAEPALRQVMGEAAREAALTRGLQGPAIERYEALYADLLRAQDGAVGESQGPRSAFGGSR